MNTHVPSPRNTLETPALAPRAATKTPAEFLRSELKIICEEWGFRYFLLASFPRGDMTGFGENCVATNWPVVVARAYDDSDLFHSSKIVATLRKTILPIRCSGSLFIRDAANLNGGDAKLVSDLNDLGDTHAFSLHDSDLHQFIFAFSGRGVPLTQDDMLQLFYRAMSLLDAHLKQYPPRQRPAEMLSKREIECLRWSAAGKSSDEIAIILDLSPYTVVGYLKTAMRKLDSVNRMQAVAMAFRYRLL